jgi:uroporphyrinogen decarboxylase
MKEPNFDNLLKVLRREAPEQPTLFEFFLNGRLYARLAGPAWSEEPDGLPRYRMLLAAFRNAGYDYATVPGSSFSFPRGKQESKQTISLNENPIITDRRSFEAYEWLEPDGFDYSILEEVAPDIPPGMKLVVCGPNGVLENVIRLVGFDNLCFMLVDDPRLAQDVFDEVGSRLVRHYELAAPHDTVGACISNDDWGFKTQTMISPEDMRRYVFPWHKKIVEAIHAAGKPAILHSCGNLDEVMCDIMDVLRYDGKHSYEDAICPVEEAYRRWAGRIAILGGIDLDFICRSSPEEIRRRSLSMLELSATRGSYALGTGNSVPEYIDDEKYFAMTSAVTGPLPF